LKNIKLGIKLIGGFALTALIALIIGLTGIFTMRDLSGSIESMGSQSLPSVEHLMRIKGSVSDLTTNLRTLLSSELSVQERKDIPTQIQNIREAYKKSADAYTALSHDAEEAAHWKEAQTILANLAGINNKVLGLNENLVKLDIMSPDDLMGKLQQFRGDHYKLMSDTAKLLATGEKFDGGTDHTACGFGKWFSGFATANPKFKEARRTRTRRCCPRPKASSPSSGPCAARPRKPRRLSMKWANCSWPSPRPVRTNWTGSCSRPWT